MNRQQTSTPCSTSTPNDDRWPRFLVDEAADDNRKPLTQRSDIFALNKAIEWMGGTHISVKPMSNGKQLLVHFGKKIYSDKLLYRTKELNDTPVKVTPHRTLNYSRCVIWCKETCKHGRRRYPKGIEISRRHKSSANEEVKRWTVDTRRLLYVDYKWPGNSQGNRNWLSNPMLPLSKYGHNNKFCKNEQKCANADRQVMRIKIAKMKHNVPMAMVIIPHTQEIVPNGKLKRKSSKANFKTTYPSMKPDNKLKDLQLIHPKIHMLALPSHTNGPTA